MKTITKIFALAIVLLSFAAGTFAQVTASATATAIIVTPITISKNVDMNFGIIAPGIAAGTVVLTPAGGRTASGVSFLPSTPGTVTAASFTVNGEGTSSFAITLPTSDYTITKVASTETMIVNLFTSTPSVTGALVAGTRILLVGATLNVGAAQVTGTYTNATGFDVTVNYN